MTPHTKKLIATLLTLLVWLPAYSIFIVGLSWRLLPGSPWYLELLFYALAGTLWIIPIGLALPWMYRDSSQKS
jgi:Protein of unknown function (DUF2842)